MLYIYVMAKKSVDITNSHTKASLEYNQTQFFYLPFAHQAHWAWWILLAS